MLDAPLRRIIDPPLDRIGARLAKLGVTANAVTVCGFGVGAGAWLALALQNYETALVLIAVNRIADGLDTALGIDRQYVGKNQPKAEHRDGGDTADIF